jgi:transposase-like protein
MGTSGKRLDEGTRKQAGQLLREGLSRRNVARRLKISTRTVHKIAKRG